MGTHTKSMWSREFVGIKNTDEFATEIDRVMTEAKHTKKLSAGRTAYWDGASGTIVIHNPTAADRGTAFKPVNGKTYFDNLK
jgi:filamentous hemagglutinin